MKLTLVRAITVVIALCFSNDSKSQETDIDERIELARSLLLEGKRAEALGKLQIVGDEKISLESSEKLSIEASKIATFFITEEGQKLYELGESLSQENPDMAESKYKEALEKEGENVKVLNSAAMLNLEKRQCKEALNWVKRALAVLPELPLTRTIQLRVLDCLGDSKTIAKIIQSTSTEDKIRGTDIFDLFTAREMIKSGQSAKGIEKLRKISESKNPIPEVWYWRWKLDPEEGQLKSSHLERYLKICKSLTPRLKRKYKESGAICARKAEAESALKGLGVSSDESKVN